jgi:hypothetical protein
MARMLPPVAPGAPADDEARRRRAFDDVAGDGRVRFHGDAFAALVLRLLLAAEQVAQDVALHDREPAALVEVRHRDAGGGGVDEVAGDERTLEGELGVERHLAQTSA